MKRRDHVFMHDIIESINRIETYIGGANYESFCNNQMMVDAVIRNLEVIGEASRNISDEMKNKYSIIPWRQMTGLRNILIHEYFGVDESIIWNVITVNLEEMKPDLLKAVREEGDIT